MLKNVYRKYWMPVLLCLSMSLSLQAWSPQVQVPTTTGAVNVFDTAGNSLQVVAWQSVANTIEVATYSDVGVLGTPTTLTTLGETGSNPMITADGSGNAVVTWVGNAVNIRAARYNFTLGTWTTETLAAGLGIPLNMALGMSNGITTAVFADSNNDTVYGTTLPSITGVWTANDAIVLTSGYDDLTGAALGAFAGIFWDDPVNGIVFTSFFSSGVWQTPQQNILITDSIGSVTVKVDAFGNAAASWRNQPISGPNIFAWAFSATSSVELIGGNGFPFLNIDSNGTAIIAWLEDRDTVEARVRVAHYAFPTGPWISGTPLPVAFATDNDEVSFNATVGLPGISVAAWWAPTRLTPPGYSLQTADYTIATDSWSSTTNISSAYGFGMEFGVTGLAASENGNAVMTWLEFDGVNNITHVVSRLNGGPWTRLSDLLDADIAITQPSINQAGNIVLNIFLGNLHQSFLSTQLAMGGGNINPPSPPAEIFGKVIINRFLSSTDRINVIRWVPSPSVAVVAYRIYRNATLIAQVPSMGPFVYEDHNRDKHKTYVYQVIAVDGSEGLSTPLTITFWPNGK